VRGGLFAKKRRAFPKNPQKHGKSSAKKLQPKIIIKRGKVNGNKKGVKTRDDIYDIRL